MCVAYYNEINNLGLQFAEFAIQEKQISSLKSDLDTMLSKSSTANYDIIQELQNTIRFVEPILK